MSYSVRMSGENLTTRVEEQVLDIQLAQDAAMAEAEKASLQEADPYNQLVNLVAQEARDFREIMRQILREQQPGLKIGKLLLRRDRQRQRLSLTGGYDYITPHASSYYLAIETPIFGQNASPETDLTQCWVIQLRSPDNGSESFYSEKDADRPPHYGHSFTNSPLYIQRRAQSLSQPSVRSEELWYTIFPEAKQVNSTDEAGDIERLETSRSYNILRRKIEEEVDKDFPDYVEIIERHEIEMDDIRKNLPPEERNKPSDLDILNSPFAEPLARHTNEWTNFIASTRGSERQRRIRDAMEKAFPGGHIRAGTEAVEHCLGLLRLAKQEISL